jgi:malonyl-CoA/methylmalonyl-CoA synthetase
VSVVGTDDEMWGQVVCALIRLRTDAIGEQNPNSSPNGLDWLQTWLGERVAPYKVPSRMLEVDDIPKNVMGKVNKKAIAADYFG